MTSSGPLALQALQRPVQSTLIVLRFDAVSFVVYLLTLHQRNLQLTQPTLVQVQTVGDDRVAFLLDFLLPLAQFLAFKQKLTRAALLVVVDVALFVLTNKDRTAPHFLINEDAIGVTQVHVAVADALDLRPGQFDAGLYCFQKVVFVLRLAVYEFYLFWGVFGHGLIGELWALSNAFVEGKVRFCL